MNRLDNQDVVYTPLPILSDDEAKRLVNKGWSFFNVYSIRELRDVYIIYKENIGLTVAQLYKIVDENINFEDKEWSERRVLENINALKNIKLVNIDGTIRNAIFQESQINTPLSESERKIFEIIFFSYFRFLEISSWFISPDKEYHKQFASLTKAEIESNSKPIYYYCRKNRFTDTFFYNFDDSRHYIISNSMSHLMRFWDVYLKWGTTLGLLGKFNLNALNIKTADNKDCNVSYFIKEFEYFDLLEYIVKYYPDARSIFIPDLIFSIVMKYRYSILILKDHILEQIVNNEKLTFERTSEIFIIKGKKSKRKIMEATLLYPNLDGNYISHIIIRK